MRKRYVDDFLGEEPAPNSEPLSPSKKGRKFKGCVLLFVFQIILLGVWGALFFVLGMSVQRDGGQAVLREIQTQVGMDATSLNEIIDNPIESVSKTSSITFDTGVVVEVLETKRLVDSDFKGALPSTDREWWGITFKGTNHYTKPVGINVCLDGVVDQDGNSYNCQLVEYYLQDKSEPKNFDAFLIMDPTFSDEAYIVYGFPYGTQTLTWPIETQTEKKTIVFALK